jgi:XTP/dITP diphosphohydrolase
MNLIIATNNKHKAAEIKEILRDKFSRIYTAKETGIDVEPNENGATFFDNAMIKAKEVFKAYLKGKTGGEIEKIKTDYISDFGKNSTDIANDDIAVLADDSGLCVDFLDGAPGVYSARYAGENCSYADNNKKLLNALKNAENRKARFVCSAVLLFKDGSYLVGEGFSEGEILRESAGQNGFGYDPIFYSYDLKKTFSETSGEEKNSVSHRGRALNDLLSKLHFEK